MPSIADILGGGLGELVKDIVGSFKLDPQVKAQVEEQIEAHQDELQEKEMELNAQLNATAGENIRVEQQSNDKYVTRARPSWAWGGLGIIAWNYCVMPFLHACGLNAAPIVLPDAFWWTVGTVVTGYVFNRTAQEIMQMPGESSIKLPLGIQIGNKS